MATSPTIIALAVAVTLYAGPVFAAAEKPSDPTTEPAAATSVEGKPEGGFEEYMEKHGERLEKEMENVMKPFDKGMQGIEGDTPQKEGGGGQDGK